MDLRCAKINPDNYLRCHVEKAVLYERVDTLCGTYVVSKKTRDPMSAERGDGETP